MITIPPEGLRKLAEARDAILAESSRFVMSYSWVGDTLAPPREGRACGTAGCLAGWLCYLGDGGRDEAMAYYTGWVPTAHRATTLLGLDLPLGHSEQFPLFQPTRWPRDFAERYLYTGDHGVGIHDSAVVLAARAHNAKLAAELVDEVIKQGGIWWV